MPRIRKKRLSRRSSERTTSCPLQESVSASKVQARAFPEAPAEDSEREPSGFSFMGLVFFGSDSEEDEEEKPSEFPGSMEKSRKSMSSKNSKQKMIQLTKLRKKEGNGRYQLHDSDDFSNSSEGTSDTALLRYLNQHEKRALPISSPEKIIMGEICQSKQGTKAGGGGPTSSIGSKQRSSKSSRELEKLNDHLLSIMQQNKASMVSQKKRHTYVEPSGIFCMPSLEDCDDTKSQGSIQRIQPYEEKRQPMEEYPLVVGRVNYETYDREDKPKTCKLWPGGKNRQDVLVLTFDDEDDDADSFLQFHDEQRQLPEVDVKKDVGDKKIWDHSDLLERMDSLEDKVRGGNKTKSCFLMPLREGRSERDTVGSDTAGIKISDSFSDLVEERKNKRGFFPLWKASKYEKEETRDSSANTDSPSEQSREQPNETIYFDTRSTGGSFEVFFDERKGKTCWPAKSNHKRPDGTGDNSTDGYLLLPSPSKRSSEKRMRFPSLRLDTERKRFFPPIIQSAPEDEHHAVTSAAEEVVAIIEKQDEECRREKAVAIHEPKNTQWRQLGGFSHEPKNTQWRELGGFGTDSFVNFDQTDDQSFISRDLDWSVAATSVISGVNPGRKAGTNMRPLLDDDGSSTEDDIDDDSIDSGWFTLESLAA